MKTNPKVFDSLNNSSKKEYEWMKIFLFDKTDT